MLSTQLIQNFGTKLGFNLELDESGSCSFEVDSVYVTMTALEETNEVAVTADVGALPQENVQPLLMKLLEANYQFQETHGATLSVNEFNHHVNLCLLLPAAIIDENIFENILENFINTAEFYAKILEAYPEGGVQETKEEESKPFDETLMMSV